MLHVQRFEPHTCSVEGFCALKNAIVINIITIPLVHSTSFLSSSHKHSVSNTNSDSDFRLWSADVVSSQYVRRDSFVMWMLRIIHLVNQSVSPGSAISQCAEGNEFLAEKASRSVFKMLMCKCNTRGASPT